jgi:hypothetical protein
MPLRRWAMIGLVVCGMSCVGLAMLWVRSGFYSDDLFYARGNSALGVFSYASRFGLKIWSTNRPVMMPGIQWVGHPLRQLPTDPGVLSGVTDFAWRRTAGRYLGSPMAKTEIAIPIWFPMLILGGLAWFCSRKGGNAWFALREEIHWLNPRLRTKVLRFVTFCAAGAAIGAIVEAVNITLSLDHGAGQLIVTTIVSLMLISILILATRKRIQWHRAILWLLLEVAGCIAFFGATMDRMWYFFGKYRSPQPEILQAALVFGVGCYLGGAILILFMQVKPRKEKPGPYCRGCRYCLIGVPDNVCPECGRPFTIDELGIPPEALVPRTLAPPVIPKA